MSQVKERVKVSTVELDEAPAAKATTTTAEPGLATGLIALGVAGLAALFLGGATKPAVKSEPEPSTSTWSACGYTSVVNQIGPATWDVTVEYGEYKHNFRYEAKLIEDPEEPGNFLINHYLNDELNDTTTDDIYELFGRVDTILRYGHIKNGICLGMLHDDIEPEDDWIDVDKLLDKVVDTVVNLTWTDGFKREMPTILEPDEEPSFLDDEDEETEEFEDLLGNLALPEVPIHATYWNKYVSGDGHMAGTYYRLNDNNWVIDLVYRDLDDPTDILWTAKTELKISKGTIVKRYGIQCEDYSGKWNATTNDLDRHTLAKALTRFMLDTRTTRTYGTSEPDGSTMVMMNQLVDDENRKTMRSFIEVMADGLAEQIKNYETARGN